MSALGEAAAVGAAVGLSLVLGSIGGTRLRLSTSTGSALTAFGGGLLMAAVALELVPEADERAGTLLTALGLVAGTAVYVAADWWLHREPDASERRSAMQAARTGRMTMDENSQAGKSLAAGLLIDGVPESLALGLTVAEGKVGIALLVGVVFGNVVEAYGAARLIDAGALRLMAGIGAVLAVVTVLGGTVLSDVGDDVIGGAQALAAGAVLAVISITIVPETFNDIHRRVAAVLILGFVLGYVLGA